MNRRGLLVGMAAAVTLTASAAFAQEPIVFGVITPLSPPGETGLGQLVKRGSEIAVRNTGEASNYDVLRISSNRRDTTDV